MKRNKLPTRINYPREQLRRQKKKKKKKETKKDTSCLQNFDTNSLNNARRVRVYQGKLRQPPSRHQGSWHGYYAGNQEQVSNFCVTDQSPCACSVSSVTRAGSVATKCTSVSQLHAGTRARAPARARACVCVFHNVPHVNTIDLSINVQ